MSSEITKLGDSFGGSASFGGGAAETVGLEGTYVATCYDANGVEKWSDTIHNLTTNVGRKNLMDSYFANSGGGAIVMGLGGANGSSTFTPLTLILSLAMLAGLKLAALMPLLTLVHVRLHRSQQLHQLTHPY